MHSCSSFRHYIDALPLSKSTKTKSLRNFQSVAVISINLERVITYSSLIFKTIDRRYSEWSLIFQNLTRCIVNGENVKVN